LASRHGRGTALRLDVDCPTYESAVAPDVAYLDIAGVHDDRTGTVTLFAVNRHGEEAAELDLSVEGFGAPKSVECTLIKHDDLEATNTQDNPDNVAPRAAESGTIRGGKVALTLPPYSYSMIRLQL
jgi:alpha-L-arabinofuranosidase